MKWIFLLVWIAMSVFLWQVPMQAKRVRIGEEGLYVSNYLREIRVPFSAIRDVTASRWIRGNPITVQFREATAFGSQIMFLPLIRVEWNPRRWNEPHPIVGELKQLAGIG